MTASDSKSYLGNLNNLVDAYNSNYHHYTHKKPIEADYSASTLKALAP